MTTTRPAATRQGGQRAAPRNVAPRVPNATGGRRPVQQAEPVLVVPTLLGALAVLAATLAIPPMVSGDSWFWRTVEVVMVLWLVGVGARMARVPAAGVVLVQVIGACVALTAMFTTGGFGGVIPNGTVIGEAGDLLAGAWDQIRTTVSPAPASTELAFLICLSVGITALIVDIMIAVCRAPALVALPLLCIFSVPASIDLEMLPWEAFAAPAMMYALLLTASGLTGRRIGAGAGLAQVVSGVSLAALATVIALVVAGSVTGIGTAGRLPRTASGPSTNVGLSPFAWLEGNLQRSDPVDMLRVSGLESPRYLRTVGLQQWTPGKGWSIDTLANGALPNDPDPGTDAVVSVTALAYQDEFLPIYDGTTALAGVGPEWSYDSALQSVHRADPITPQPYVITADLAQQSGDELRADTVTPGGLLTETGELSPQVVTLASSITAGATTAFDKANALNRYFTDPANGFSYSLDVPVGTSGDPLLDFLTLKQGYCAQYASAMAVMLRAVGVPSRVAIGFTQGARDADGSYLISSNDAHAWVEVPFNSAGWVQFDPTPLGGGQGGQQGFTEPTGAAPTTSAAPTAAPTLGTGVDESIPEGGATATLPTRDAAPADSGAEPVIPAGLWWALILLVAAGAAATGPTVVRRRRRDHRLAVAEAGGPGAAAAAWQEIEDLATDHGITLNAAESARVTATRLAKAAHLSERGRADLRALVTEAELDWYAGRTGQAGSDRISTGGVGTERAGGAQNTSDRTGHPGTGTATVERPATASSLGAAPRMLAQELIHNVPLSPLERLVPRSVRPAWWRD